MSSCQNSDGRNLYVLFIRRGEKLRAMRTAHSVRLHDPEGFLVAVVEEGVQVDDALTAITDDLQSVPKIEDGAEWVTRRVYAQTVRMDGDGSGSSTQRFGSVTRLNPDVLLTGTLPGSSVGMLLQGIGGGKINTSFWTSTVDALRFVAALFVGKTDREADMGKALGQFTFVRIYSQGEGFLSGFSYDLPADYDLSRFRRLSRAIHFPVMADELGNDLRPVAMGEMLAYWREEGFDWKALHKSPIERIGIGNMRSGGRLLPPKRKLRADVLLSIATIEVADDLERLIPTAAYHMPEKVLHLVVDHGAACVAKAICEKYGIDTVKIHEWITPESLLEAEAKLEHLVNHSDYWKPGPIWWKLEGLRRIVDLYQGNKGVLLVDSDIVFAGPVDEEFLGVSLVMSPFYWPDPVQKVQRDPAKPGEVHIAQRDGWYNAGYLLTDCPAVAKAWLELYESGRGGFYEQWIMGFLPQLFRHDVFGTGHNWGQWRKEAPREGVVSLHIHARTQHSSEHGKAVQAAAAKATGEAIRELLSWSRFYP